MTSQIKFVGPEGMTVVWDVSAPGAFDSQPLVCPGRYSFPQGAIYRLKLANIPGRPGVELYPTLEVGPMMPRTEAFLAHNTIPVQFTPEDFDQVLSGNFVTKVIYLPDPEFQELALAGVETLVSTRLDPGVDPIVEADRRGAILAIVRLGDKDLQVPNGQPQEGGVAAASYDDPRELSPSADGRRDADGHAGRGAFDHADGLHRRSDRAAVRHADVRHADRPARSAQRAAGSAGRPAETYDCQPHRRTSAETDGEGEGCRQAGAGLQLSQARRPRPHRRTHQFGRRPVRAARWATAASGSARTARAVCGARRLSGCSSTRRIVTRWGRHSCLP